jgi:hypothetical protein
MSNRGAAVGRTPRSARVPLDPLFGPVSQAYPGGLRLRTRGTARLALRPRPVHFFQQRSKSLWPNAVLRVRVHECLPNGLPLVFKRTSWRRLLV